MSLFLLKNTSDDRSKATLHRSAAGMTAVINIAGIRLDPGMQMYIEKEHFERIREVLVKQYQDGTLEVLEVEPKEGVELRMLAPERTPTPGVNPHGEYNPAAQKVVEPTEPLEDQTGAQELLRKPLPGTPPSEDVTPGPVLANPAVVTPVPPEDLGTVPPRPLIEQAVLPGEIAPREAHIAVQGEQGPGTQPIESLKEVSGPDAPAVAPPVQTPEEAKPRLPDTAGGAGAPVKADESAPSQSSEPPAKAEDKGPGHTHPHAHAKSGKKRLM